MLRLLRIVDAAGKDGISTRKPLDGIDSHITYIQRVIDMAYKEGYINGEHGEQPGPGQFAPYMNTLTEKGKQLLQSQLSSSSSSPH